MAADCLVARCGSTEIDNDVSTVKSQICGRCTCSQYDDDSIDIWSGPKTGLVTSFLDRILGGKC